MIRVRSLFNVAVWICMLVAVYGKPPVSRLQCRSSSEICRLQHEIHNLKAADVVLKQKLVNIDNRVTIMNANMGALTNRVDIIESKIETIVDQIGVDLEVNNLDSFLGNMEAQLLGGDPNFDHSINPTAPPEFLNLTSGEEDILGSALFRLSAQNQELSSQMLELQHRLSTQPGISVDRSTNSNIESRLNLVEQIVAVQNIPRPGGKQQVSIHGGGIAGEAASGTAGEGTTLSEADEEALEGILENVRQGAVSFFSVSQTSSVFGTMSRPKAIPYNVKFAVKGGGFHGSNGTFVCQIAGYYFIIFTVRTFDHKYLGVNLMKNDVSLTAIFSDKHKRSVMQTQSVIAHLAVGDQLWIRIPPNSEFGIHGDQHYMNTFSGFLLYKGDV